MFLSGEVNQVKTGILYLTPSDTLNPKSLLKHKSLPNNEGALLLLPVSSLTNNSDPLLWRTVSQITDNHSWAALNHMSNTSVSKATLQQRFVAILDAVTIHITVVFHNFLLHALDFINQMSSLVFHWCSSKLWLIMSVEGHCPICTPVCSQQTQATGQIFSSFIK